VSEQAFPLKGKLNVLGSVAIGSTIYTEVAGAAPSNGLIVEVMWESG